MPYSAAADLERAVGGAANLLALTDTDASGAADAGIVDAAIAEADAEINTYASKRFSPAALATLATPALKALSARMAARVLRRNRGTVLASDVEQATLDQKWLENLAAGKVLPGSETLPDASTIVTDTAGERESIKTVSRNALKGMW